MIKPFLASLVSFILLFSQQAALAQDVRLFSIGSGDVSGNYYPVARLLCEAFNASDDTWRRCSPEPSAGSLYNLETLRTGEVEFAIVQSDWVNAAFAGDVPFDRNTAISDMRVVMPLFPETLTILAASGSDITAAIDLAGKTVDIGRPASGRNATIRALLEKLELPEDFFANERQLEPYASLNALCEGSIDAAIFVLGHPSDLVSRAVNECGAKIASFAGERISRFMNVTKDYRSSTIDLAPYGFPDGQVPSISVMATLVTRTTVEEALVKDLAAAIRTDASKLAESFPVLGSLEKDIDAPLNMSVPVHAALANGKN
jgi:TRAP transporter TAXI family solute receptor